VRPGAARCPDESVTLVVRSRSAVTSPDRRRLLSASLGLLIDLPAAVRYLCRHVGALNRNGTGGRLQEQEHKLRTFLLRPKRQALVDAAMAVLGAHRLGVA
jgi:hypothetical protein